VGELQQKIEMLSQSLEEKNIIEDIVYASELTFEPIDQVRFNAHKCYQHCSNVLTISSGQ